MPIKFCPDHPETIFLADFPQRKCLLDGKELLLDGELPFNIARFECSSGDGTVLNVFRCMSEDDCIVFQAEKKVEPGQPRILGIVSEVHVSSEKLNDATLSMMARRNQ